MMNYRVEVLHSARGPVVYFQRNSLPVDQVVYAPIYILFFLLSCLSCLTGNIRDFLWKFCVPPPPPAEAEFSIHSRVWMWASTLFIFIFCPLVTQLLAAHEILTSYTVVWTLYNIQGSRLYGKSYCFAFLDATWLCFGVDRGASSRSSLSGQYGPAHGMDCILGVDTSTTEIRPRGWRAFSF